MISSPWFNFMVAAAVGLLIGLERERSKGEGPRRRPAGIRTFTLASLLGAASVHLGGNLLLAIATGAVAALVALSYFRSRDADPGLTSEVGLIATVVLGGLAMSDTLLAMGLAAAVAAIFAIKAPLHRFVRNALTDAEVADGLVFAVATLVIWPQLPDRYLGPFEALNPHILWLLVVLVLGIGAAGHVATRALGTRFGLPLSGFASGFASAIATIGAMAGRASKEPSAMMAAVAGASLSTVATFVQMSLLLFTVSRPTLLLVAPALAAGGIVAALYGAAFALATLNSPNGNAHEAGRAFSPAAALGLAATMAVMLVAAAALKERLGDAGLVAGAALAGAVDTHSAAVSTASLVASGKLAPQSAVLPILAAMTANALVKTAVAFGTGSRGFAIRVVPGIILSMAAAWAVAIVWSGLRW